MKTMKVLLITFAALTAQACSTYATDRYAMSSSNLVALKEFRGTDISVGAFTATEPGRTSVSCRAVGPIPTPDGETFENYVRNAFVSEMQLAEVYSENSNIVLTGNLDRLKPSSMNGSWDIAVTIASNNGASYSVEEMFEFKTSFYGETACNQTAQAMMPAVQNVISKIVSHPQFSSLLQ